MKELFSSFIIVLTILLNVLFSGCSRPTLKTTIDNSENGTAYLFNTITQKLDTINYRNYSFSFITAIEEPTLYHLYFEEINNWQRPIYLILSHEPTIVRFDSLIISGLTHSWLDFYPNRPSFINDPNNNESFYDFQELWASFSDSIILLSTTDVEKDKHERKILYERFITQCSTIIENNSNKLVSAFIIKYLINNGLLELNKIQEFYSFLGTEIKQSSIGQTIGLEASMQINSKAPNFEIFDINGGKHTLTSLLNKKILLHFWSTTCAPCIEEMPLLLELFAKDKNLVIINISLDTDYEIWSTGIKKLGIDKMINSCDLKGIKSKIAQDYHINFIPANYLLNEQGEVIAKKQSIEEIILELGK